jgi:hypothetical protein
VPEASGRPSHGNGLVPPRSKGRTCSGPPICAALVPIGEFSADQRCQLSPALHCIEWPGHTEEIVKCYGLGVWFEPDSPEATEAGLRNWLVSGAAPDCDRERPPRYRCDNPGGQDGRGLKGAARRRGAITGSGNQAIAAGAMTK